MSVSVQEMDFDAGAEIEALSTGRVDIGAVASFVGLVRRDRLAKNPVGTRSAGADEATALQGGQAKNALLAAEYGDTAGLAPTESMTLEHYPGMTESALAAILAEARQRWTLQAVRVIHRVGRLRPGDRIVFVGVASAHRSDAFAACEFIMDYLKTQAPFWKKEETTNGGHWVDARESDDVAVARWK